MMDVLKTGMMLHVRWEHRGWILGGSGMHVIGRWGILIVIVVVVSFPREVFGAFMLVGRTILGGRVRLFFSL